ncbi:MAG: DUF3106 domain-containing protein [Verrucomicrobiota bacterium]|nr:DUF3106 domain-containing protein [Verrucomicrobiota bacterium]
MKLRIIVIRLLLPTMLAVSAADEALAVESPFVAFKKIVSLPEASREAAVSKLKISSERYRKIVKAKVREYAAMSEAERNRKLDALDFRWHLMPLMKAPQVDRTKRLASVPERFRADIEQRLTNWDKLDDGVRADLLKNESFLRYLSSFGRGSESRVALTNHIEKMPTRLREGLVGRLKDWREKPKPERRRMVRQFHRFFEMPVSEQERALRYLPDRERQRMEASLAQFKGMSRAQRELVIKSFDRLASKSQSERAAFFRNTDRWNGMSEVERKTWRKLVTQMPPLPPGFGGEPRLPLPPGLMDETAPAQSVVTNTIP